ncbi:MAG: aminotransferase class V-fold PLP-dependent enzyme [Saprospiraceae bacterium]|nr:aminotransferase class V-fold PLP-dependent enzyme [Saprospiraceae bacterium]
MLFSAFCKPIKYFKQIWISCKPGGEIARNVVSQYLNCLPQQIFWTSGATESNNIALQGSIKAFKYRFPKEKPHILTSAIEHKSVLETCKYLANDGVEVTF